MKKKILLTVFAVILVLATALTCTACNKKELKLKNDMSADELMVALVKADVKSIQGLTGVKLSQGTHIITMKYQTPGLKTGAVLSILMVGILGAICFARKFRNR